MSPYGALQVDRFRQVRQHGLEVVIAVVEPSPKHYLADDVGYSIVEQVHRVKWLT